MTTSHPAERTRRRFYRRIPKRDHVNHRRRNQAYQRDQALAPLQEKTTPEEKGSGEPRLHRKQNPRKCFLDKAAIIVEGDFENGSSTPNPGKLCSVTRVEEVKMMIRLLPIWATTIMFWTTYARMITFSVEQASTMERSIGRFQIPAGSLTIFFVGAILITLAIYDRIIIPSWKKWKGKPGFTNLQRIWIGLLLSMLGMAVAAITEGKRLSVANRTSVPSTGTLPTSVFMLIPQFFLVGLGEAFI
ncbi:hypothetical protein AAC387_Pa02g2388 [Persea americana]